LLTGICDNTIAFAKKGDAERDEIMVKPLAQARLMRLLNGEVLNKIASDGTIFKGAAQKEINRRETKRDRKDMRGREG